MVLLAYGVRVTHTLSHTDEVALFYHANKSHSVRLRF
jgi:hypothetical protein